MRQENSARSEGFQTTSTHRHVLDLKALAEDLNVMQLGEVEISLEHLVSINLNKKKLIYYKV